MVVLDREDMSRQIRSLRKQAEEIRAVSDEMRDPKSKRTMRLIGASYDVMAERLETTAAHLSLAKTGY
jgi:hypothetical protein